MQCVSAGWSPTESVVLHHSITHPSSNASPSVCIPSHAHSIPLLMHSYSVCISSSLSPSLHLHVCLSALFILFTQAVHSSHSHVPWLHPLINTSPSASSLASSTFLLLHVHICQLSGLIHYHHLQILHLLLPVHLPLIFFFLLLLLQIFFLLPPLLPLPLYLSFLFLLPRLLHIRQLY